MNSQLSKGQSWQLPDGVEELLPEAAWQVETLRRRFTDHCHRWGFDLVMPPMIEFIDSLLTGTGETMNLQTFKLVDQQNGRTLGIRADITPQVARMDAHALQTESPNRLFYIGTVLRTRTDGFGGSRSPMQFGAELFGHEGPESDIEIIRLMLDSVQLTGVDASTLILDLGHVGVYKSLNSAANLEQDIELELYDALQRGSTPDVRDVVAKVPAVAVNPALEALEKLGELRGTPAVLDGALKALGTSVPDVVSVLNILKDIVSAVEKTHPDVTIHIDLGELRGYRYHTGALFAVHNSEGVELARGGRYDAIGAAFGHPRAATGFSGDMKNLSDLMSNADGEAKGIYVEYADSLHGWDKIRTLRNEGMRVVVGLPDLPAGSQHLRCDRQLVFQNGDWLVEPISR